MAKKYTERVFITEGGVRLGLVPIPNLLLANLADESGRPEPPMKPIEDALGEEFEPDFDSPGYKKALDQYLLRQSQEAFALCVLFGVSTNPPENDPIIRKLKVVYPQSSKDELKILWVRAILSDDEIQPFIEKVTSQTIVTEEGVADATDRFRDVRERDTGDGLPAEEPIADSN